MLGNKGLDPAAVGPVPHERAPVFLGAQHDVVHHAHGGQQRQLLGHPDEAAGGPLRGAVEPESRAVHPDHARIGGVHAQDDPAERGLAGAVLSDQPMDATGLEVDRDVL